MVSKSCIMHHALPLLWLVSGVASIDAGQRAEGRGCPYRFGSSSCLDSVLLAGRWCTLHTLSVTASCLALIARNGADWGLGYLSSVGRAIRPQQIHERRRLIDWTFALPVRIVLATACGSTGFALTVAQRRFFPRNDGRRCAIDLRIGLVDAPGTGTSQ